MSPARALPFAIVALLLAGCASVPRTPMASADRAYITDILGARMSDEHTYRAFMRKKESPPPTILALSGGGADGSYGAGFLKGWSDSGTRPDFDIVTGSSVGSLIAPFAFLGMAYDNDLESIFTSGAAEDLLRVAVINEAFSSGIFKSRPMRDLIAKYADDRLIEAVAGRYRTGKLLLIATTNLDAQRTTLWNMGEIAASKSPDRFELFRSILAASAAIPGILPPVFIDVRIDGVRYAEMHIDGGVTSNVLAVPEQVLASRATSPSARAHVFVIVNGKLSSDSAITPDYALPIVARAFQTSVKANTRNAMIATYDFCRRNNWQFNATAIDAGRAANRGPTDFDTNYMTELFAYGYRKGASGKGFRQNLDGLRGLDGMVAADP